VEPCAQGRRASQPSQHRLAQERQPRGASHPRADVVRRGAASSSATVRTRPGPCASRYSVGSQNEATHAYWYKPLHSGLSSRLPRYSKRYLSGPLVLALLWMMRGPKAGHRERRESQRAGPRGRREGSGERNRGATNRNRLRGGTERGERARNREALVTKAR
jgi:hypothetical protein